MTDIADAQGGAPRSALGGNGRTGTDPAGGPPDRRQGSARALPGSWRAFLRAHARITRALESELLAEQDLSLAAYDVLVQLAEAPGRQLRMTELADAVLLSRSGVTRLVDRLERAGLVRRMPVESDGRGVAALLTPAGLDRLRVAARTHLRGIAEHFTVRLTEADHAVFERLCTRLADRA